jgi:acetyl esterase/lipase
MVCRWAVRAVCAVFPLLVTGAASQQAPEPSTVFVEDVQYAEGFANEPRRNRLDLYLPRQVTNPPLVMFVHGGTWTGGSKDRWAHLALGLCTRGIACAAINTQLHPFAEPADMVADCGRALAWLHTHAGEHGYDGDRLFLMGHSSGGHLVTWLAFDDARREATGVPRAAIAGVIGLSGVYELRTRDVALAKIFGEDQAVRAVASPFVYASAGDPPVCLFWGEHDIVRLPLSARMLRDRLRDVGVPVVATELAKCNHADYVLRLGTPGDVVLDRIVDFVRTPPAATPPANTSTNTNATALAAPATPPVDVTLAEALPCQIVPATGALATCVVWLWADDAERTLVRTAAAALARFGVASALLDARAGDLAAIGTTWRRLRAQGHGLGIGAPAWLAGVQRGGFLAAATPLSPNEGLRGRIIAGAALGARSLAQAWPGVTAPDLFALLSPRGGSRSPLLIVHGQRDPQVERDESLHLGIQLVQKKVEINYLEVPALAIAAAWQRLGSADDVLLPMLRAFVLP